MEWWESARISDSSIFKHKAHWVFAVQLTVNEQLLDDFWLTALFVLTYAGLDLSLQMKLMLMSLSNPRSYFCQNVLNVSLNAL